MQRPMENRDAFPSIVLDIDEAVLDWRSAFVAWMGTVRTAKPHVG